MTIHDESSYPLIRRTLVKLLSLFVALPFLATAATARETPECRIRILRSVADDSGVRLKTGQIVTADFVRRDAQGISFCADHGACVARMTNAVQTAQPIDCHIGKADSHGTIWLDPNPKMLGTAVARQMLSRRYAKGKLVDLGFSMATSGSYAEAYAVKPGSRDGRLVARVLAGSPTALAALKTASGEQ